MRSVEPGTRRTAETALDRAREVVRERTWLVDVALLAALTAVAAALRLALLGDVPYGVHPDEAQVGTDAHRIMEEGWIGVYTHAALGQPAGHAYLATPIIWLLGDTAFALRLPLALVAIAAVPLLYALVRVSFGRAEAFFAAALLAISYWHLLYSRVAHWSISYGTVVLAVLLCVMLGMRQRRMAWFVAGGALLGLGVYTYNIYPIAIVAVAAFLAITTAIRWRERDDVASWLRSVGAFGAAALVVALPFIVYIADPDAYYWEHILDYSDVSVTQSREFEEAGFPERARLIGEQAWTFARTYAYDADPDIVDGNGLRPVFEPLTLLLIGAGLILAWRYRREPMVIAALCCTFIIPLPAVLQQGSIMRQPVAAAPFVMFIAALPLAAVWRAGVEQPRWRILSVAAVAIALGSLAAISVRDYFFTWRDDPWVRLIYHEEITAVSEYLDRLPDGTYVYFYSDRAPLDLETRQFLAPGVEGEDRSREFSDWDASIESIDRSRPVVFALLEPYMELIDEIEERYPGGRAVEGRREGRLHFRAYELPARPGAREPAVEPP